MYSLASRVAALFLDPLAITFALWALAWVLRRRRPLLSRILSVAAFTLIALLACPVSSVWLVGTLESQYPDRGIDKEHSAQAIVVLGGSLNMPSDVHHATGITNSSDRLLTGLRLYRAGKAPLIEVSGGDSPLLEKTRTIHEADEMRSLLDEWGVPDSAILVEDVSVNTHENAVFTRRLLQERGIQHIILVTSAMHMPRAVATFRKVGFDVEPAPADFLTGWEKEKVGVDWVPNSSALVDSNNALHELLGLLVYRIRGWA
jgi:Uncharacterized conserved protein